MDLKTYLPLKTVPLTLIQAMVPMAQAMVQAMALALTAEQDLVELSLAWTVEQDLLVLTLTSIALAAAMSLIPRLRLSLMPLGKLALVNIQTMEMNLVHAWMRRSKSNWPKNLAALEMSPPPSMSPPPPSMSPLPLNWPRHQMTLLEI